MDLDKKDWDDLADLIDAGFELLKDQDKAYLEMLTATWDAVRKQLEAQGYNWDPRTRDRGT